MREEYWAAVVMMLLYTPVAMYMGATFDDAIRTGRDKAVIRKVQSMDIGEGVTLPEGVRACYGEVGIWGVIRNRIVVSAGAPGYQEGILSINSETGEMKAYSYLQEMEEQEVGELLNAAVRKVKGKDDRPWPKT